jgi:hypothetical protein
MAGVKVTDLPVLASAASDDVLYIVDTSTNQSRQIEVENLNQIPLAGTTAMEAASITHTSTGKTASVQFIDGGVGLEGNGAAGTGYVFSGEDNTIIQYDDGVSGYISQINLADGSIALSLTGGAVMELEWDGSDNKLSFFNVAPVSKQAAIADATDEASAISAVNDILAVLRSYGLIAI